MKTRHTLIALTAAVALHTTAALAGPDNDYFTNRIALAGTSLSAAGTNLGATIEPGEPNHGAAFSKTGGKSIWWTWTASFAGYVTVTDLANFNHLLAVYAGNTLTNLTLTGSDYDSSGYSATVNFNTLAGATYQIAVDGQSGSGGSVFLTAKTLAGSGAILAVGGDGNAQWGGGAGGGGRVAIYADARSFAGTIAADGGLNSAGSPGSVYQSTNLPLSVVAQSPSGAVNRFVTYVDLTFNQPADPATFTKDDLVVTTPSGTIPAGQITVSTTGGATWRVGFPLQIANGTYSIQVGSHIASLYGQEMTSAYQGAFDLQFTSPTLSSSSLGPNLKLSWSTVTGLNYQIQSTTNVSTADWRAEGARFTGTGGVLTTNLPVGLEPAKFYRLRLLGN